MADAACRIAILGGGITGLTAAYTIARARLVGAPVDEFLLEAGGRLGGSIRTEQADEFTVEGGPDSFLSAKTEASDLCCELGLERELTSSNDASRRTYILWRGRLEPLPEGLAYFVPARLRTAFGSRLIPLSSKFAILRDAFRRRPALAENTDESVAHFVRRRLGEGILDTIVDPLLSGIYGGDTENMSVRAVLPFLVAMEQREGSLVRGALKSRKAPAPARPLFTTLKPGLEALPRALAAQLNKFAGPEPPRLWLNQRAETIGLRAPNPAGSTVSPRYSIQCQGGGRHEADAILLALPAPECARLLAPIDTAVAAKLGAIPYTPAVTLSLGYNRRPPELPAGFGFLVPRREGRKLLACTFVHAKFGQRAPEGAALLRCFLGGVHQPDITARSDEELIGLVERELREILGIRRQPLFERIYRWPCAMPQYRVGHETLVEEIGSGVRRHPGVFLAGNAYQGVGIPDCIRSARRAAEQALGYASRFRSAAPPMP